jgi:hypothetical protein
LSIDFLGWERFHLWANPNRLEKRQKRQFERQETKPNGKPSLAPNRRLGYFRNVSPIRVSGWAKAVKMTGRFS